MLTINNIHSNLIQVHASTNKTTEKKSLRFLSNGTECIVVLLLYLYNIYISIQFEKHFEP